MEDLIQLQNIGTISQQTQLTAQCKKNAVRMGELFAFMCVYVCGRETHLISRMRGNVETEYKEKSL